MRAFIGTLLSTLNQDVSDAFGVRIVEAGLGVLRPVPPRSAHLTHVFLGEIDQGLTNDIAADLHDLMAPQAPVPFRLGRPEVLLAGREPRLVLAPVEAGGLGVAAVTRRIVDRLRRHVALAAIAPPRSPHVTLARFRRGARSSEARRVTDWLASPRTAALWQDDGLEEVQVVRSELTPTGPIYEVLARARAGGPA